MLYSFYVNLESNKYRFSYQQENNGTIYDFAYWTECLVYDFCFNTELKKLTITPTTKAYQTTRGAELNFNTAQMLYNKIGILNSGEFTLLATADLPRNPSSNKKIGFVALTLPTKLECYLNGACKQTIELQPNQHYCKNGILINTTNNTLYIEDQFGLYDTYFVNNKQIRMELFFNQSVKPILELEPLDTNLELKLTPNEWRYLKQKLVEFVSSQLSGYANLPVQTALEHLLIHSHGFLPTKLFAWFKWETEGELQRSKHIQNQTAQIVSNFVQNLQYHTTQNQQYIRKVVV